MDELTLLQRFEPSVHFTKGELFFPCSVDGYLERCRLIMRDKLGREKVLAYEGEVSKEKLGQFREVPSGHIIFLRFVGEPMTVVQYKDWLLRPDRPVFRSQGRMARVGLFSRIIDSFFDASLLVRGVLPGGTAAAAEVKYREIRSQDPRNVYYGRVIREGGYIVLHYIFFYVMNDFRSTFHGINDHESDWEQVFVYLSDEENPSPLWVAYASHDFSGDDLRRRWDDPELEKIGTHPVVYAGAGSHSSYFLPGEYLISIEPRLLHIVNDMVFSLRLFWANTLGQGADYEATEKEARLIMPYIDYARGDGISIGPEQERRWSPVLLTEEMGWAMQYRGLWGMDTRDRFDGERGPAGPKFNRDGTIRVSWYDPLGWAGLDKVSPPKFLSKDLEDHIAALSENSKSLDEEIVAKRDELRLLELEVQALQRTGYLSEIYEAHLKRLETAQSDLQALYARRVDLTELQASSQSYLQSVRSGDKGDPHAHITVKRYPEPSLGPMGRYVALWAAISGSLLLFAFVALLLFNPSELFLWAAAVTGIFLAVESIVWGRFTGFLLNVTVVLAIVTSLILVWNFLWQITILVLLVIVVISNIKNLREIAGR
jgi:hypothetical protein